MDIVAKISSGIIKPVIEVLGSLAILLFFWGVLELIYKAADPEARKKGSQHIMYGIFGIFVIVAVNAIISYAGNFLTLK